MDSFLWLGGQAAHCVDDEDRDGHTRQRKCGLLQFGVPPPEAGYNKRKATQNVEWMEKKSTGKTNWWLLLRSNMRGWHKKEEETPVVGVTWRHCWFPRNKRRREECEL